jgi:hypothetical protein
MNTSNYINKKIMMMMMMMMVKSGLGSTPASYEAYYGIIGPNVGG